MLSVALISQEYLTVFNSALYFRADDGTNGRQLWKYDGVDSTSIQGVVGPSWLTVFNNALYFTGTLSTGTAGKELCKYDGVNAASVAADINTGAQRSGDSYPVSARAPATHAAAGVTRTRVWARARMPPWLPPTHARLSDEPPHGACSRSHSSRRNI
mgnify:CR=1 FL=1